ncbi:hypothetical protein [Desulfovibrio ferrophilus]|uniref:Transcriptional regulator LysR family n=1 Tax=Desulfovibrio ferrophilus TaxID=241368 RepID=A0A2Z6AV68_9BACT|nr:hypothetical protein [Desulfovibrio ferrophilus]BBD07110.1 transcriptional regulator LysR family [Desulfovibrio ferrophilus]
MKLRTKRILILFSIFLNIGFIAAAAHHALFFTAPDRGHNLAVHQINQLKIPESKRRILLEAELQLHQAMGDFHQKRESNMNKRMLELTGIEPPTLQRLEALTEQQLLLHRYKIETATTFLLRMREEVGPEKTREFIENMKAHRPQMPH